ncbi:MAG: molybdenum cofactor biosynthesis protein MoaE [bacterium]|nr:molybdenum cofactor biosynthesis protein MoaE [bacterium]
MQTQLKNEIGECEIFAEISAVDLDPARFLARARSPRCGGLVLFSGDVRELNLGQSVSHLEYEAHENLAVQTMQEILGAAAERWQLGAAGCVHRVGVLQPGESAVLVVAAAAHRAAAYQANEYIIHRVKHEAPIWKKEVYVDGSHRWGHNCDH